MRTYSSKSSLVTLTVWLELNVLIGRVVVLTRTYSSKSSLVTLTVWLELNVLIGRVVVVTRTYSCKSSLVTLTVWLELKGKRGSRFFFPLRVPLIHYVDISRRHSHKCVCTIMVINVQNQQFNASPNSSNVTNLAKRSEFC